MVVPSHDLWAPAEVSTLEEQNLQFYEQDRKRKAGHLHFESKKARQDIVAMAAAKTVKIRECNMDKVFNIQSILDLPFPSLTIAPNRFQLKEGGVFTYQARSDLKSLYDKIVSLWNNGYAVTVNVVGTIGYGKSHMLAVLVLLLLKNPIKVAGRCAPFVCYIPDCRKLLQGDVVTILRENILLNMPDFDGQLKTVEDIGAFMQSQMVILVADQWNTIDDDTDACTRAKEKLGAGRQINVTKSNSANGRTLDLIQEFGVQKIVSVYE